VSNTSASLSRRIASAGELLSVVRTMKALAGANVGQYEQSVQALADYNRTVELGLSACFRPHEPHEPQELPASSRIKHDGHADARPTGAVVIGSDQGLVGRFNDVVAEFAIRALAALPGKAKVWAIGERVRARLADAGLPLMQLFTLPSSVQGITPLVGEILVDTEAHHREGEITELHLFYNRPEAGAAYSPVSQRLLPLDDAWRRALSALPWPTKNLPEVMGGGTETLRALIREYLFISLFRACAESLASENASRLAAMQRAEKNIRDQVEDLNGEFHRVRQSGIDEELFDVIAGFEALSGDRH
jgi:F-type H+-transporting ATPase subunit gamma